MHGFADKLGTLMRNVATTFGRSLTLLLVVFLASPLRSEEPVTAKVKPGQVIRWTGSSLLSCSLGDESWDPVDEACWYPLDLDVTGDLELVRRSTGGVASRRVQVVDYPYPEQRLQVEEKYVSPPADQLDRIAKERAKVDALFEQRTPRRFTLPLASPLAKLPAGGRFGSRRVFNGVPKSPHSGADFSAATGTTVFAVADGTVALAEDQYYAGKSVFVDHGGGLVSMSFHLSQMLVDEGATVKRGDPIGKVGATGRVTGPHLHFGLRWLGARVDPELLIAQSKPQDIR
ncbi:MAG: M23 family metallopeptidase [Thermoanaerobaculia bacterium]|nr:M23 family metallopeptidase [Thermoanaerobaculia bacterium]